MKSLVILSSLAYLFSAANPAPILKAEARKIRLNAADHIVLSIYNSEDYIATGEDDSMDIISAFKEKVLAEDNVDIEIAYSTFDTNEIMLSNLQTGAQNYDLICTSDYMVEKMMAADLVVPFLEGKDREALYSHGLSGWETDTYLTYGSPFLDHLYGNIYVQKGEESLKVTDYMRGYMWGTLGIMYNPNFSVYADRGLSADDVKVDMSDYASLWDSHYQGTFQIKDSMRDSYAIALLQAYKEEFETLLDQYQNGTLSEEQYNKDINIIFNNICHIDEFNELSKRLGKEDEVTGDKIVDLIQTKLISLKDNSYGLEVDSGKTDIQTGTRTGINMAWSGDAVYAIESAEEYGVELYYSVPRIGGNVWLDAWVIPSTVKNQEYAQKFIDFLSDPEIAAANVDYIGYTSAIAGDSILEQTREWYDVRMSLFYQYDDEAGDWVRNEDDELVLLDEYISLSEEEFTNLFRSGAGNIGGETYISWEDYSEKNDLGWTAVDLSYFFNGSLENFEDNLDTIFWTDEYEEVTSDGLTVTAGRAFYAQYPAGDTVASLMVMEDYGENNEYVLRMWEIVKSGSTPMTVAIILIVEAVVGAAVLGYFLIRNGISKGLRKKRREEKKSQ